MIAADTTGASCSGNATKDVMLWPSATPARYTLGWRDYTRTEAEIFR